MPWHMAQVVKDKVEQVIGDPTRSLRGHPRLEGGVGAREKP